MFQIGASWIQAHTIGCGETRSRQATDTCSIIRIGQTGPASTTHQESSSVTRYIRRVSQFQAAFASRTTDAKLGKRRRCGWRSDSDPKREAIACRRHAAAGVTSRHVAWSVARLQLRNALNCKCANTTDIITTDKPMFKQQRKRLFVRMPALHATACDSMGCQ